MYGASVEEITKKMAEQPEPYLTFERMLDHLGDGYIGKVITVPLPASPIVGKRIMGFEIDAFCEKDTTLSFSYTETGDSKLKIELCYSFTHATVERLESQLHIFCELMTIPRHLCFAPVESKEMYYKLNDRVQFFLSVICDRTANVKEISLDLLQELEFLFALRYF